MSAAAPSCRLEQSIATERSNQADLQNDRTASPGTLGRPIHMKKMRPAGKPAPQPEPQPQAALLSPHVVLSEGVPQDKWQHLAGTNPFDTPPAGPGGSRLAASGGPLSSPISLVLAPEQHRLRTSSESGEQLDEMKAGLAAASGWVGVTYPAQNVDVLLDGVQQTGTVVISAAGIHLSVRPGSAAASTDGSVKGNAKAFLRETRILWSDVRNWQAESTEDDSSVSGAADHLEISLDAGRTVIITPLRSAAAVGGSTERGALGQSMNGSATATQLAHAMAVASEQARQHSDAHKIEKEKQNDELAMPAEADEAEPPNSAAAAAATHTKPQLHHNITVLAEYENRVRSLIQAFVDDGVAAEVHHHAEIGSFVDVAKSAAAALQVYRRGLQDVARWQVAYEPSKLLKLVPEAERARDALNKVKVKGIAKHA